MGVETATMSMVTLEPATVPMMDETDATLEALKFLSDGNRLRILGILAQRESCVCELIEQLGLPQPLMSYHLRRLREAGLVRSRRKAQWVYYSLEPEAWQRFTQPIRSLCHAGGMSRTAAYGASDCCDARPPLPEHGASLPHGSPWPED